MLRHNAFMIRYGIQDYEPRWLNGVDAVRQEHGERLAALVTRTLRHVWAVWDLADDSWFVDAPVLMDFGSEQVEIDHQKLDDLSITWNTIDPARAMEDSWDNLTWRPAPFPEVEDLCGRPLRAVELLEWVADRRDFAYGSVAVGFDLAAALADDLQRPRRERLPVSRARPGIPSSPRRGGWGTSAHFLKTVGRRTSRPVRRILYALAGVAAIHLGVPLPVRSSGLPAGSGGPPSNACAGPEGPFLALLRVGFTEPPRSPGVLVGSYPTVSPLPEPRGARAVCSLWHCPAGRPGLPLTTTLPCGVRTFLGTRR